MFCSECGTRADEDQRFCAQCGTSLAGAPAPAPPPDFGDRPGVSSQLAIKIGSVAAGAVALVVIAVLVAGGLGGDGGGGADSPEDAVRQLVAAGEKSDGAGAIDVLNPDETGSLDALYGDLTDALEGSGIVDDSGTLEPFDLAVENLKLQTDELASGIVKVRVTGGRLNGSIALDDLKPAVGEPADGEKVQVNEDLANTGAEGGLFVMTRRRGDKWFISPTLTLMEYLVASEGLPRPDFSRTDGGDDDAQAPADGEALVRAVGQAISARDVDRLAGLLSEGESELVRPYSAAIDALIGSKDDSLKLDLRTVDVNESGSGDGLTELSADMLQFGAEGSYGFDFFDTDVQVSGTCVTAGGDRTCLTGLRDLVGAEELFVQTTDGGRRLSVSGTLVTYLRRLVDRLGSDGLRRISGTLISADGGPPSPPIRSGETVTGKLNDAGYASRSYKAAGAELLAVASDGIPVVVDEKDTEVVASTSPDGGTAMYELPAAGTYEVFVLGNGYKVAPFRLAVERAQAQPATTSSRLTGRIGPARQVVYEVDVDELGATFTPDSDAVRSESFTPDAAAAGSSSGLALAAGLGDVIQRVQETDGSYAGAFADFTNPENEGEPGDNQIYASGRTYVVVSGSPGTRFSATLSPGSSVSP